MRVLNNFVLYNMKMVFSAMSVLNVIYETIILCYVNHSN